MHTLNSHFCSCCCTALRPKSNPWMLLMCSRKWSLRLVLCVQKGHKWGFSPVCVFRWWLRCWRRFLPWKTLQHTGHIRGRRMVWKENTATPQDIKFLFMQLLSIKMTSRLDILLGLWKLYICSLSFICDHENLMTLGIGWSNPHPHSLEGFPGVLISCASSGYPCGWLCGDRRGSKKASPPYVCWDGWKGAAACSCQRIPCCTRSTSGARRWLSPPATENTLLLAPQLTTPCTWFH